MNDKQTTISAFNRHYFEFSITIIDAEVQPARFALARLDGNRNRRGEHVTCMRTPFAALASRLREPHLHNINYARHGRVMMAYAAACLSTVLLSAIG